MTPLALSYSFALRRPDQSRLCFFHLLSDKACLTLSGLFLLPRSLSEEILQGKRRCDRGQKQLGVSQVSAGLAGVSVLIPSIQARMSCGPHRLCASVSCLHCSSCRKICCCAACRRRKNKEGSKAGGGGGSDLSPPPSKPKKSSSHKDHHRDRHSGGAGHGYSRHDASDVLHYGPGGVPTNDEGYPIQSSRRDRGLHGSSHSPRMMGDSPSLRGTSANLPRPYDLDEREDRKRHSRGGHGGRGAASGGKNGAAAAASSEYDDSDNDGHNSYSSSGGDDSRSSSDADDGAGGGGHSRHHRDRRGGAAAASSVPLAEFASDAHDDPDAPSLPSAHFTSQLSSHIKLLAEESARNAQSPFARLYKSAQQTKIKKKIKAILVRPDLKKEKKVEMIAALLTPLEDAPAPISSGGMGMEAQTTQQPQASHNAPTDAASSAAAASSSSSSMAHPQQRASPMATA